MSGKYNFIDSPLDLPFIDLETKKYSTRGDDDYESCPGKILVIQENQPKIHRLLLFFLFIYKNVYTTKIILTSE